MTQAICDITTDEVNVDVVVEPQADTMIEVANRAGGMEQVFHDNTLIGNGNSVDLGVNTDLIATKEYVDEKVESIDTYTKDQIDGKLTAVDAQIDANADAIQKTREDYIQADSEIHQILNNHAENLTTLHNDVDDLGDQVAGIEEKIPESASATNPLVTKEDLESIDLEGYATTEYVNAREQEIRDDINQADSELQSQITAQASAITANTTSINGVKAVIPDNTSDTNPLINKQQLLDEEMDIREDLNEGLSELQTQITAQAAEIATKQDQLTAGDNIIISNNVISATGAGGGAGFDIVVVQELPATGQKGIIYLLAKDGATPDVYDEYVWIESTQTFELIGTTQVDLTDYVKKTDYATGTVAGVVRVGSYVGTTILNGFLCGYPRSLEEYKSNISQTVIAKGTLENIKDDYVKRGLTENTIEFTDDEKAKARTLIGAGSQTDLNNKADDNKVVHLAGNENITGIKTFTLPDNIKFTASKTTGYTPGMTNATNGLTPATNVPWSRNGWHDHFAFGQSFTISSKEVSTDGEAWVADDRDVSYLFAQKEYGNTGELVFAPNAGEMGFRFVLQSANIAYSNIQWIEIGFAYTTAHTVRLLIESSSDGAEWTEVHNSTTGASATNKYLYVGNLSGANTYLRISVIKTDATYLDVSTRMLYVKGWTTRKGNQGRGIEFEKPYFWDNVPNIMPIKSSGCNLGSAARKWNAVYATKLNNGADLIIPTQGGTLARLEDLSIGFDATVVDQLPATGEKGIIYLVPKGGEAPDIHDEYIWIDSEQKFEFIGSTAVDLTNYVKNTDYATSDKGGVIKANTSNYGVGMSAGYLIAPTKTLEQYNSSSDNSFISKGTLENIKNDLVKRAVTENDITLTDEEKTVAQDWLGIKQGASLPILMAVWSDHVINDMSWLRADTFSWQSGDVYVAAYEHLVNDVGEVWYAWEEVGGGIWYTKTPTVSVGDTVYSYNFSVYGQVSTVLSDVRFNIGPELFHRSAENDIPAHKTDTIGNITITYYQAQDGHKICLPDQESNIAALYEATGVAWYFILDTTNKQFKLPRAKPLSGAIAGNGMALGLTNGTNNAGLNVSTGTDNKYLYIQEAYGKTVGATTGSTVLSTTDKTAVGITTDSTKSGIVAERENTDQYKYLYFYVGNFAQEAIEQTAGLNAELFNGKADIPTVNGIDSRVEALESYDYIVERQESSAENNYTWYFKFKSGQVIMGGLTNSVTSTGQINCSATMPVPVKTVPTLLATPIYISGSSVSVVTSYRSGNTIYVTLEKNWSGSAASTTAQARWFAVGIAE